MNLRHLIPTLALVLSSCGPAEGEERPLVRHWDGPGGMESVRGTEVYMDGEWVLNGPVKHFDREGNLRAEGEYSRGLESGFWREYYNEIDGGRGAGEYREGKRHGEWNYFHAEGSRHQRGTYKEGKREGLWTEWYVDGPLKSEIPYEYGERHGRATFRNRDGSLDNVRTGVYVRGEKLD